MSRNIDVFAAYQHRDKPKTTPIYRFPLKNHFYPHHHPTPWTVESINRTEPFLPSIKTFQKKNDDGYQAYRRNDFAHNHLFVAKQKLAGVFLDQSTSINDELIHWFDSPEAKLQRQRRRKRPSPRKSSEHVQLSVINLTLNTSKTEQQRRGEFPQQWINPFDHHHHQSDEHERPL